MNQSRQVGFEAGFLKRVEVVIACNDVVRLRSDGAVGEGIVVRVGSDSEKLIGGLTDFTVL